MSTKLCSRCKKEKSLSEYYVLTSSKDGKARFCIPCSKEYKKEHYLQYRPKIYARNKINKKKHRDSAKIWFNQLKETSPCTDCGKTYAYYVMDFHHLRDKKYEIAYMVKTGFSQKSVLQEIEKCIILCSNCHRVRTHKK